MKRAALIFGNDLFDDPAIKPLRFAERDAVELHGFFKHRARYDDVRLLQGAGDDAILNCAAEMVRALGPGDLFVCCCATHGVTHAGRYLLLCRQARLGRLKFFKGTVPVDLLKDETAQPGVQRAFIFDCCRSDLEQGRETDGPGLQGEALLRDIVASERTDQAPAPLALLCACAEGKKAWEVPQLAHGLFSRSLLDEMSEALDTGQEVPLGEALQQRLARRMAALARKHGLGGEQRPWVQLSDAAPILFSGRPASQAAEASATVPCSPGALPPLPEAPARGAQVKCPLCGRRNAEADTFECQRCGRDYLCNVHFAETELCCKACAEQQAQAAADQRAHEEKDRQARERAERQAEEARQEQARQGAAEAARRRQAEAEAARLARQPKPGKPWENSLGMRFVPVVGTQVLFCIWETRVQDSESFVKAKGLKWEKPSFAQGPTHPAVLVSWEGAQAFCGWLTEQERTAGLLGQGQSYRLPTDLEWSAAVGLAQEEGRTPQERAMKVRGVYPWGTQWPPPQGAGNYASSLEVDVFEYTSPVGSFTANQFGLYDLGGNVWEWCEDFYNGKSGARVLRGGSWNLYDPGNLLSSDRFSYDPDDRLYYIGFRVVLAGLSAP